MFSSATKGWTIRKVMEGEQKQKKEKIPRKLLMNKYIPTDSGPKKNYAQEKKKFLHLTCTKRKSCTS